MAPYWSPWSPEQSCGGSGGPHARYFPVSRLSLTGPGSCGGCGQARDSGPYVPRTEGGPLSVAFVHGALPHGSQLFPSSGVATILYSELYSPRGPVLGLLYPRDPPSLCSTFIWTHNVPFPDVLA